MAAKNNNKGGGRKGLIVRAKVGSECRKTEYFIGMARGCWGVSNMNCN